MKFPCLHFKYYSKQYIQKTVYSVLLGTMLNRKTCNRLILKHKH